MKVILIAVGQKMPGWVNTAYEEYSKRLASDFTLELVEIAQPLKSKKADVESIRRKEAELILKAIPAQCDVIALDERGKNWSTVELSNQLEKWKHNGKDICLLVGGPDGLSDSCKQRAVQSWSLSRLTFPHPLVRVLLAEQLYRAQSILNHHPYHRA